MPMSDAVVDDSIGDANTRFDNSTGTTGPMAGRTVDDSALPDTQTPPDSLDSGVVLDAETSTDAQPTVADAQVMSNDAMPVTVRQCAANEYVNDNMCVRCPLGTENEPGDSTDAGDTMCTPIICGPNQRVQNRQCIACVEGTENDGGDSAAGPNTACDPILWRR